MATDTIIEVKGLEARYGELAVLENVTFDVFKGEILVILGGSGCGKSTLLRHMSGLTEPTAGRVYIDNVDITSCDEERFQETLRKIGILFQSSALLGSMTVAENVALPIIEYTELSNSAVNNLVRMKLSMVDLQNYENFLPSEISGGMKKRAGLARSLALNPKILFLDEPTAGLDPVAAAEIDALIKHLNEQTGTTMVIVTHDLESIFGVAHRIIMLDKDKKGIIATGDPQLLKDESMDENVQHFFKREPRVAPYVLEEILDGFN
ncbi:MAG: ATP-binding cassette domain-containing protein [Desulfobacterales bacterium]|nr:ATP-binding cassette domain-containing protein [Desulfobacterales bacterium]